MENRKTAQQNNNNDSVSEIDRQLAEARQKLMASGKNPSNLVPPAPRRPGRRRLTAEEREQRRAEKEEAKLKRRQVREARRAERQARNGDQKPHMAKVEKAAKSLPEMNEETAAMYDTLVQSDELNLTDIESLVANLLHHVRVRRTNLALETVIKDGQAVRIIGGEPRLIGQVGIVEVAKRIRCYVRLKDQKRSAYLFTSDLVPLSAEEDVSVEEIVANDTKAAEKSA